MTRPELKSLLSDQAVGTPSGRIVRLLSERGALSATQIAGISGLAKSTVSTALAELRRTGMVVDGTGAENGKGQSVGRPATVLTLNPRAGTCVGLLFGLEHIQMIVADVSHALIADVTLEIEPDYTPAQAAQMAKGLIQQAYSEHAISIDTLLGVGIAVAGPINPSDGKVLRASGVPTWAGIDIRTVFEPALQQPIFADNESNCSAIAEMTWGAAMGFEDFVLFTIDLGIGGAIVSRGHVMTGIAGAAGEFGHMSIDPQGELCRCGNRGCLELYASFKGPVEQASRRFGRKMNIEEVVALAREGDVGCLRLIEDTAEVAGRGLGIIGAAINPGLIVIGGRLGVAGDMLLNPLEQSFNKHTLVKRDDVSAASRTKFVASRFSANDACMGAVGLVLRHHGRRS
ncbi:MAG TPA: ROK family transcriptional regulator [Arsenicitalea sp.]|nr:ROK family transcriptional regulator [Arsenicitalea sp.]